MIEVIVPDIGRDQSKVYSTEGGKVLFESQVGEWQELREAVIGKLPTNYKVEIQGSFKGKYFIHQLADHSFNTRKIMTNTKINEETKVLYLAGIALVQRTPAFRLGFLVPINQYSAETKKQVVQYFSGVYDVKVNDIERRIVIDDITLIAEGAAMVMDLQLEGKENLLDHKTLRFIEIGSKTINFGTLSNNQFYQKWSGTLEYGCQMIINQEEEPSGETVYQFARKVIGDVTKKWPELKKTDLLVAGGGGAFLIENHLQKEFPNIRFAPDLFSNARGAAKMVQYAAK